MEKIDIKQFESCYNKAREEAFADDNIVLLHIAEEQTSLVYRQSEERISPLNLKSSGKNSEDEFGETIPFGYRNVASLFFMHNPPTESEIEMAINNVEDSLMPLVDKIRPLNAQLVTFDVTAQDIGTYAKAQPTSITVAEVEDVFSRLALIIGGRPFSTDVIPSDNGFIAYELLLREVMHHLGFGTIKPVAI